jgi:phage-related protein
MANSIYNVKEWDPDTPYKKNDIVLKKHSIGGSGIAKTIRYYYALQGSTGENPETNNKPLFNSAFWGGYKDVNGKAVPYFLWTPSYNLSTKHNPRTLTVNFGNGYEQRTPDGVFNNLITIDLQFDKRQEKEASAIVQFLKSRKGAESFIVKKLPPIYEDIEGFPKVFICSQFSSGFVFHENFTVSATFVQKNN